VPTYEFTCPKCQKEFTTALSVKELEQGSVKCPDCGESNVKQGYEQLYVQDFTKELTASSWSIWSTLSI
jgi:putative FmdB family regulatory protein